MWYFMLPADWMWYLRLPTDWMWYLTLPADWMWYLLLPTDWMLYLLPTDRMWYLMDENGEGLISNLENLEIFDVKNVILFYIYLNCWPNGFACGF